MSLYSWVKEHEGRMSQFLPHTSHSLTLALPVREACILRAYFLIFFLSLGMMREIRQNPPVGFCL